MSLSNRIVSRILMGSAIGALLGLILLIAGIVVVMKALEGRVPSPDYGHEAEHHETVPGDDADHDPYAQEAQPYGDDEGYEASSESAYPSLEAPEMEQAPTYYAEPLPPQSRSQWRSIFEEDEPNPARPPQAPEAAPTPRAQAAPRPSSPPRPATPRQAPQPQKDEESLFY